MKKVDDRLGYCDVDVSELLKRVEELKRLGYSVDKMHIEGEPDGYDDEAVILFLKAERTLEGEELEQATAEYEEEQNKYKTVIELRERAQLEALKAKYENGQK